MLTSSLHKNGFSRNASRFIENQKQATKYGSRRKKRERKSKDEKSGSRTYPQYSVHGQRKARMVKKKSNRIQPELRVECWKQRRRRRKNKVTAKDITTTLQKCPNSTWSIRNEEENEERKIKDSIVLQWFFRKNENENEGEKKRKHIFLLHGSIE